MTNSSLFFTFVIFSFFVSLQLNGLFLFVRGFFPDRAVIPRAPSTQLDEQFPPKFRSRDDIGGLSGAGSAPLTRFGRVVVMVIDALRANFLFGNETNMHYTRHLLDTQQALGFVAQAHTPTVTLPRIKVRFFVVI